MPSFRSRSVREPVGMSRSLNGEDPADRHPVLGLLVQRSPMVYGLVDTIGRAQMQVSHQEILSATRTPAFARRTRASSGEHGQVRIWIVVRQDGMKVGAGECHARRSVLAHANPVAKAGPIVLGRCRVPFHMGDGQSAPFPVRRGVVLMLLHRMSPTPSAFDGVKRIAITRIDARLPQGSRATAAAAGI
jgi:hypothetical protein